MTNLYEAGDINQTDAPGGAAGVEDDHVDDVDDVTTCDVDDGRPRPGRDDDADDVDEGVGEGNELRAVDGRTPLTVLPTWRARCPTTPTPS